MLRFTFGSKELPALLSDKNMLSAYSSALEAASQYVRSLEGNLPGFAARAGETSDLSAMQSACARIKASAKDVLVFGTGGSSLGAQAATAIARYTRTDAPTLHFPDSLDPFETDLLFATLKPETTHVLAVSKSGTTAETLLQLLTARAWLEGALSYGQDASQLGQHFTFITEPGERAMRAYAESLGAPVIDHPLDVGGRFSVLTSVGMLPVMLAGLSVEAFRSAANAYLQNTLNNPEHAACTSGAALAYAGQKERGYNNICLMPYAESLRSFTRWFGQLWAESLGKDGLGTTPLSAVGPVDQHSQLQLYLDGPEDKLFTFITPISYGKGPRVDAAAATANGLDYMAGRTIGDTVTCQSRATADALRARGRIVRDIQIDTLDAATLGTLFMHFMLETVITAHLMGIDAYDQPAVEDSKILTRQYLRELAE